MELFEIEEAQVACSSVLGDIYPVHSGNARIRCDKKKMRADKISVKNVKSDEISN